MKMLSMFSRLGPRQMFSIAYFFKLLRITCAGDDDVFFNQINNILQHKGDATGTGSMLPEVDIDDISGIRIPLTPSPSYDTEDILSKFEGYLPDRDWEVAKHHRTGESEMDNRVIRSLVSLFDTLIKLDHLRPQPRSRHAQFSDIISPRKRSKGLADDGYISTPRVRSAMTGHALYRSMLQTAAYLSHHDDSDESPRQFHSWGG